MVIDILGALVCGVLVLIIVAVPILILYQLLR